MLKVIPKFTTNFKVLKANFIYLFLLNQCFYNEQTIK